LIGAVLFHDLEGCAKAATTGTNRKKILILRVFFMSVVKE